MGRMLKTNSLQETVSVAGTERDIALPGGSAEVPVAWNGGLAPGKLEDAGLDKGADN